MNSSPIRVLVVDDDEDDFILIRDTFREIQDCQYLLSWVETADEVVGRLASEKFDVCLCDYRLGPVSGLDLIKDLREKGSDCPVILVTGDSQREIDLAATDVGANDYMEKSGISSDRLERVIRFSIAQVERRRRKRTEEVAEEISKLKSAFLAMVTHELRTPLNAVIGFSQLIKDQTLGPLGDATYVEYANNIYNSGQNLLGLIDDVLDVSKIDFGEAQLHEESIDVHETVQSIVAIVAVRAQEADVALLLEVAGDLPPLYADPRKFKQVLINLLNNAVKFTLPGGKVTLKVWAGSDSGYVFQIIDTGIGIAFSDIPKALAPFQQVDSDLNRQFEGTGLGLPLSKSLVELHGGYLDLQSEVGVGTTVTVRFPAGRGTGSTVGTQANEQPERKSA